MGWVGGRKGKERKEGTGWDGTVKIKCKGGRVVYSSLYWIGGYEKK